MGSCVARESAEVELARRGITAREKYTESPKSRTGKNLPLQHELYQKLFLS
jgi:hypothetical protein